MPYDTTYEVVLTLAVEAIEKGPYDAAVLIGTVAHVSDGLLSVVGTVTAIAFPARISSPAVGQK